MTHFFYSVQHQTATFYLRLFPFVVRMKSEKPKAFMAFSIHESAPGANADVCCVPSFHRLCGIFRQPKVTGIKQFESFSLIEYGGILTFLLSVITSDTNVIIIGKSSQHVCQLVVKYFLSSEDVEIVKMNEICNNRVSLLPSVSLGFILRICVPQIITGDSKRLRSACHE